MTYGTRLALAKDGPLKPEPLSSRPAKRMSCDGNAWTTPQHPVSEPNSSARVLVFWNPKAGAGLSESRVQQLAVLLRMQQFETEVISRIDQLVQRATELQQAGSLRAIVAAGGDGTVVLVANNTPLGTPISVLPLGTENLLSKYLGLTPSPDIVCQTICDGVKVQMDAGEVNGRLFLLMVGCGFDADVVRRLHH